MQIAQCQHHHHQCSVYVTILSTNILATPSKFQYCQHTLQSTHNTFWHQFHCHNCVSISELVDTHAISVATFFVGLFATGILSISDRSYYCATAGFIFDITDVGDGHFDSNVVLSVKPACRPFRFLGKSAYQQIMKAFVEYYLLWGPEDNKFLAMQAL